MKTKRPIPRMTAFWLGLCLATQPLCAAQKADKAVNPVEHASFHQLVFADEDIAVLNNRYPPKGDSGFHAHHRDLFAVIVQPSPSSGQSPGKPLTAAAPYPAGATAYSPVGDEPRIHRVINDGDGVFQIIVVELRRPGPTGTAISSREAVPQYVQILDNPRLRAWRLILAPGQSVPAIAQDGKGVRVVVRGGMLTTSTPGLQDQQLALRPGDFAVQPPGETRALANSGTETIELVEMVLK